MGGFELGVEEEFDGVVAWLAVDVDGTGVVWGETVVEPVVVGEPGVWLGDGDEVACSRVVEGEFLFVGGVEDLGDSAGFFQYGAHFVGVDGVVDVDVGDLVVCDGDGGAGSWV